MDYSLKIKQVALKVELFFRGLGSKIVTAYNKHVKLGEKPCDVEVVTKVSQVSDVSEVKDIEIAEGLSVNQADIVGAPKNRDE